MKTIFGIFYLALLLFVCGCQTNAPQQKNDLSQERHAEVAANADLDLYRLHNITYNVLSFHVYDWLNDNCYDNLDDEIIGLPLHRATLQSMMGSSRFIQFVICSDPQASPESVFIAYCGTTDTLDVVDDSKLYNKSEKFIPSRPTLNNSIYGIRSDVAGLTYRPSLTSNDQITGQELSDAVKNFFDVLCGGAANDSINRRKSHFINCHEIENLLRLDAVNDDGIMVLLGFDRSSPFNKVRIMLANTRNVPGGAKLSYSTDRNQYFLERAYP